MKSTHPIPWCVLVGCASVVPWGSPRRRSCRLVWSLPGPRLGCATPSPPPLRTPALLSRHTRALRFCRSQYQSPSQWPDAASTLTRVAVVRQEQLLVTVPAGGAVQSGRRVLPGKEAAQYGEVACDHVCGSHSRDHVLQYHYNQTIPAHSFTTYTALFSTNCRSVTPYTLLTWVIIMTDLNHYKTIIRIFLALWAM